MTPIGAATLERNPSRPTRRIRSLQAPPAVVMVRPRYFAINQQTAADNLFQADGTSRTADEIASAAYAEASALTQALRDHGVIVHLFEDEGRDRPDSVFPNNWFSTHTAGRIVTYPMYAENRRRERRTDVIDFLKKNYRVQDTIDYSGLEYDGLFLEGTGAMVLDHIGRVAYVARSFRADPVILERFCTHNGYEPMVFDAVDGYGEAIYHTNVLMCVGTEFALVCLEGIADPQRRNDIASRLSDTGRSVIDLTQQQLLNFAGNAYELSGSNGRVLAMSERARRALTAKQIEVIEQSAKIVAVDIPTIELAGGSVRCMLAGVHLDPRPS
jgi:hypothetical protein